MHTTNRHYILNTTAKIGKNGIFEKWKEWAKLFIGEVGRAGKRSIHYLLAFEATLLWVSLGIPEIQTD